MNLKVKLTQIGNSQGVILPKEAIAKLKVEKGDELFLIDAPNGLTLSPYDPDVEAQIKRGRAFIRDYRETFKVLAE